MKNVTTFDTSAKLKAAGFPQPEIEVGQFWYAETAYKGGNLEHAPLCVVVEMYSTRKPLLRRLTCEHMTGEVAGGKQCFAPTATDILRELGFQYDLSFVSGSWFITKDKDDMPEWNSSNPAEAAALAWLSIHKKKNICYKTNEECRHECGGLCKESY